MTKPPRFLRLAILLALTALPLGIRAQLQPEGRAIPGPLKGWEDWATWDVKGRECPRPFQDRPTLCLWPSRLALDITETAGRFALDLTTYDESWIPLPGDGSTWPLEVKANGILLPVVEHEGRPSMKLPAGTFLIDGTYRWNEVPRKLQIPQEIGILSLSLNGRPWLASLGCRRKSLAERDGLSGNHG
jgi:hypothetical protein